MGATLLPSATSPGASLPETIDRRLEGPLDAGSSVLRDEATLQRGSAAIRVAVVAEMAVSFGVGEPEDSFSIRKAQRLGIPVVRRRSGGTGLLHLRGDLLWSVVLPRADPRVGNDFVSAYDRLGSGVVRVLDRLGIRAMWGAPFALSDAFCLLGSRGRVLATAGRALGGAAQHVTRSALLHQGTLSYEVDRRLLGDLFEISSETLASTVTSVRDERVDLPPGALAELLLESLLADPPGG